MKHKPAHPDLKNYVNHLAGLMGLGDWEFEVFTADLYKDDPGNLALIEAPENNRVGTMVIDRRWRRWGQTRIRGVVVHELMHAHLEHFLWGTSHLGGIIPYEVYYMFRTQMLGVTEMVVDRISLSWAETLPLIEEVPRADA